MRTYSRCKADEHDIIPAKGHNFSDWRKDKNGVNYHLCRTCGLRETEAEAAARIQAEREIETAPQTGI